MSESNEKIKIIIDDVEVEANPGELLIDAAQKSGTYIPRFCWHEKMKPVGMCRMCLVEVEGVRGLTPSCVMPVSEGMKVSTKSDTVKKVQEGVIEFLLINHPLDCPVCDRGGECPLQDQTVAFGKGETRFLEEKRQYKKPIPLSDVVLLDRERCIQCARCTRFAEEIAGDKLITFVERGGKTQVATFPDSQFASYFSGNTVQICPVGALTAKPYRFAARPWDLEQNETTCVGCSVGCRGIVQSSQNEVTRFLGSDLPEVNDGWLCDRGRYSSTYESSENRLTDSLVDNKVVTSFEAISKIVEIISKNKTVGFIGGASLLNEDQIALYNFANALGKDAKDNIQSFMPNIIPNDLLKHPRALIADLETSDHIVIVGEDIKETHPVLYLKVRNAVVNHNVPLTNISYSELATSSLGNNIFMFPGEEQDVEEIKLEGKVVVIASSGGNIYSSDQYNNLVAKLLGSTENALLMPTISEPVVNSAFNSIGAISNQLDSSRNVLEKVSKGEIKTLFVFDAAFLGNYYDSDLVLRALTNASDVICFDSFVSKELLTYISVFLPTLVWAGQSGTTTNIEGRIQLVNPRIAPKANAMSVSEIITHISKAVWENIDIKNYSTSSVVSKELVKSIPQGVLTPLERFIEINKKNLNPSNIDHSLEESLPKFTLKPSWDPLPIDQHPIDSTMLEKLENELSQAENIIYSEPKIVEAKYYPRDNYSLRVFLKQNCFQSSVQLKNSQNISTLIQKEEVANSLYLSSTEAARFGIAAGDTVSVSSNNKIIKMSVIVDDKLSSGLAYTYINSSNPIYELSNESDNIFDIRIETTG